MCRTTRLIQITCAIVFLTADVCSLSPAAGAQQIVRDVTINFIEVTRLSNVRSEVKAYVTVTDLNGAPITDLTKDNFSVSEDGVAVSSFDLQTATEGLSLVLLMDTTSSMKEAGLKAAKDAADRFVASMGGGDQVALYEFQEETQLLEDFTTDHNKVRNAIAKLELVDKWTCLYDAASIAVKKAMEVPRGRRAVLLLTDGKDERSGKPCSTISVDDLIALAWKQRVPLYVIGLGTKIDETVLKRIAEKTGGAHWLAPEPEDLTEAYDQIADLLQSQYLITLESKGAAGDHALVVKVDYQGQQGLDAANFLIPAVPGTPSGKTPAIEPAPAEETGLADQLLDKLPYFLIAIVVIGAVIAFAVIRRRKLQPTLREAMPAFEPIGTVEGPLPQVEEETVYVPPVEEEPTADVSAVADLQPLATLTVLSSLQLPEGESYELYARSVTMGRGVDNDIVIPDQPVSRRHAELRYQNGEFHVYDRGSRFGTRVNGVAVPPHGIALADGDQLQMGPRTTLRFTRLQRPRSEEQDLTRDVGTEDDTTEFVSA